MANENNIALYYIPGLTRIDTPYFSSLANQEAYFTGNVITRLSIADGYYPPHYTDVISIDTVDYEPTGATVSYNYLSILFRGKYYYYFVDDIEYVNEALVRLHIVMDVIQTHMFDTKVVNGIIERKFIKRNKLAGRTYIRENVSMGNFKLSSRTAKTVSTSNFDTIISCFIIKLSGDSTLNYTKPEIRIEGDCYCLPFQYLVLPLESSSLSSGKVNIKNPSTGVPEEFNLYSALNYYGSLAECLEILYLPYCNIEMWSSDTYGDRNRYIKYHDGYFEIMNYDVANSGGLIMTQYGCFTFRSTHATDYALIQFGHLTFSHTFLYDSSRAVNTAFSMMHVPALVDENYMNIEFGTIKVASPYVLHLLSAHSTNEYLTATPDGARIYSACENMSFSTLSHTTMADTTPLKYTTVNDPWNTFIAYNAGTLLTQGVSCAAEMISSGAMFGSAMRAAELSKQMLVLGANRLKANFQIGHMRKTSKVNKQLATINYGYDVAENALQQSGVEEPSALKPIASGIQGIAQIAGQCLNAVIAPQSVKENINFITQKLVGNCSLFETVYLVEDIYNVAQYYHRNGYLVLQPYTPRKYYDEDYHYEAPLIDLIDSISTRYYYNILKMSEVSLYTTIDNTLDTQAMLEDRLVKGVRFWYLDHTTIGNYYFDNVEKEYVS